MAQVAPKSDDSNLYFFSFAIGRQPFKMVFAIKGGGCLEGVSSATYLFWKMIFLKTI